MATKRGAMNGPDSPVIAVEGAPSRWAPWWLASGVLFFVSALLALFSSLPAALGSDALGMVRVSTTVAFSAALGAAGIGAARRGDALRLSRTVVVALFALALWILVGPPLLGVLFDLTSAAPFFVSALVKLGLCGAVVAGMLRSPLPTPWNLVPAIALAAVVLVSLVDYAMLSGGSASDMNTMILVSQLLTLTGILATAALGAVALRAARSRNGSVVVFGAAT